MPETNNPAKVATQLDALASKHELTVVRLSEPITSAVEQLEAAIGNNNPGGTTARTSDISTASLDAPTPASLEADLTHYKELFAKLRFSYVEQVTKEKFIRAIVGDPPLIVDPAENAELEALNAQAKAELKTLKRQVAELVAELERQGAELARQHMRVGLERVQLAKLPDQMAQLEKDVATLRQARQDRQDKHATDPELRLPIGKTAALAEQREAEARDLERQLGQLRGSAAPRKRKEAERLRAELAPLETMRQASTAAAQEAKRRKEAALRGGEDHLEERGRWWRTSETLLKQMLDIKT
ncbi:hypothetical protein GGTG_04695 [Gaeumannomyces tritici R3-111a-1]|uniref:Kinetochore protein Sos7 coiled-coil domain-containing protein n=1 Tax=Gaeumannomyces tritici (strain R3-111a-1) TaxID=644352 RepID=J3NTU6_GAET3|nr:hypothetical protein GGTG_04695 [Gaeumannomyces tritici R3-111a-1]EJT79611.1 hypothetical protein GGTG_04695 [Gaeumannomyces tritici R3-111a-1]